MTKKLFMVLGLLPVICTGCYWGPPKLEVFEEIKPSETAFMVPLEGDSKEQGRFESVKFLEDKKVAAKRVNLPLKMHSTGRTLGAFTWIPTSAVIKTDRAAVVRVWTDEISTGTSTEAQGLRVQDADGIKFTGGAVVAACIREEDTAKYVYHFGKKPLSAVVDENVRSVAQQHLAGFFSRQKLDTGRKMKVKFFSDTEAALQKSFAEKGVTIEYFGNYAGLNYVDGKIQTSIDQAFIQGVKAQVAKNEKLAQDVRNQIAVTIMETKSTAAGYLKEAEEAAKFATALEIRLKTAEAKMAMATRWSGRLPAMVLPGGDRGGSLLLQAPAAAAEPAPSK